MPKNMPNKTKEEKKDNSQLVVFAIAGKQYATYVGKTIQIEKSKEKVGESIKVKDILTGKTISLKIGEVVAGPKISMIKFKNKTRYLKRLGHRQKYSQLLIESVV
jgi:large subunit ribosomal protein L21